MRVFYGKKSIDIPIKETGFFSRGSGLMFRTRNTVNLLFDLGFSGRWAIHSYFVFFPFLAIWLDDKNSVVETQIVQPFRLIVKPRNKFRRLVEVPLNSKNKEILAFFVGKRRKV